ncbi:GNAT family N-acetyltransferase [Cohnella sp. GCM10027633]|uniref:GNAT family N-acetyltransferase n=1 Tax=unclassified Cohnella TaxID=2636738 RepID=UPI003641CBDD
MILREATEEELAYVRERRVAAYEPYAKLIPAGHWEALKRSLSSASDRAPGVRLIVAEAAGAIAGSVALFPPKANAYDGLVDAVDYPEIRMLAVDSAYQGGGVASALIRECIASARAQGYASIGLHTGEFMAPAIRLYEKFGFERVPEQDFQPADDGINVLAFRLTIG